MPLREIQQSPATNWQSIVSFYLISVFLVFAFLRHGLLFKPEYWLIGIILYIGASVIVCFGTLPSHSYFYVMLAFIGWYCVSTAYAINPQNAVSAAGRLAMTIPLLVLSMQLTQNYRLQFTRLFIYLCAGWVIVGAFSKQFREGRFEGTLAYANSWGALLLTALIMQISLAAIAKKKYDIWVTASLSIGILLTGSRSVFLIAIILVPIQLFVLRNNTWGPWITKHRLKSLYLIAIPLLMIICALAISRNLIWLHRFTTISPHASEWEARLGYYRDAWRIIMDSPLIGHGGGSWSILQYQYQSAAYSVRYLHNFWLETWIDVGLPGVLLAFLLICISAWQSIKHYRSSEQSDKAWIIGCFLAFLSLVIHSTFDFTFSYPMLFALWALLGQWTRISPNSAAANTDKRLLRYLTALIFVVISIFSIRLGIAESLLMIADQRYTNQKNSNEAIRMLEQSTRYALFPADQHEKEASLFLSRYLENKNAVQDLTRAEKEITEAVSINGKDPHLLFLQTQIDYALGHRTEAVERLRALKQQFPFRADMQEEYAKWSAVHQ